MNRAKTGRVSQWHLVSLRRRSQCTKFCVWYFNISSGFNTKYLVQVFHCVVEEFLLPLTRNCFFSSQQWDESSHLARRILEFSFMFFPQLVTGNVHFTSSWSDEPPFFKSNALLDLTESPFLDSTFRVLMNHFLYFSFILVSFISFNLDLKSSLYAAAISCLTFLQPRNLMFSIFFYYSWQDRYDHSQWDVAIYSSDQVPMKIEGVWALRWPFFAFCNVYAAVLSTEPFD